MEIDQIEDPLGPHVPHDVDAGLSKDAGVLLGVVRHERDRVVTDVDVFRVSGRRGVTWSAAAPATWLSG